MSPIKTNMDLFSNFGSFLNLLGSSSSTSVHTSTKRLPEDSNEQSYHYENIKELLLEIFEIKFQTFLPTILKKKFGNFENIKELTEFIGYYNSENNEKILTRVIIKIHATFYKFILNTLDDNGKPHSDQTHIIIYKDGHIDNIIVVDKDDIEHIEWITEHTPNYTERIANIFDSYMITTHVPNALLDKVERISFPFTGMMDISDDAIDNNHNEKIKEKVNVTLEYDNGAIVFVIIPDTVKGYERVNIIFKNKKWFGIIMFDEKGCDYTNFASTEQIPWLNSIDSSQFEEATQYHIKILLDIFSS